MNSCRFVIAGEEQCTPLHSKIPNDYKAAVLAEVKGALLTGDRPGAWGVVWGEVPECDQHSNDPAPDYRKTSDYW